MIERRREEIIENWLLRIVSDGGIDRYDDLHIDVVDKRWTLRENWTAGALESYRIAGALRDRHNWDLSIVLAFALSTDYEVQRRR